MEFKYAPMFQLGKDETEYYLLTKDYVSVSQFEGHEILKVQPEALTLMAQQAFHDVSFMLRRSHNEQVAKILRDPEASANDKYVALTFLRNAEVLLVFRVDEDGGVAEHRLRSCGRDDKGFIGTHHIVFEIIELAFVVLVDDFDVAQSGSELWVPVDDFLTLVDEPFFI